MTDQLIIPQNVVEGQAELLSAPAPEQLQPEQPPPQPVGTEWTDMSGLTPQQKSRFDRIYWNMKEHEQTIGQLRDHSLRLAQVVQEMQSRGADATEAVQRQGLMQRLLTAKETGNIQEEVRIQGEMSTLAQRIPRPTQIPIPPAPPNPDIMTVEQWSREVGSDGNFRRPWALEGHPRYQEVYNLVAGLVNNPQLVGNTEAILSEVDRRMGSSLARPAGATVMSPGQVRPQQGEEIALDPDEIRQAQKFGMTPKQYADQKVMIGKYGRAYSVPTVTQRGKP